MSTEHEENNTWIPLSEAAKGSPHDAEYLSLLARRGKLPATKINDVWHTTPRHLGQYLASQQERRKEANGRLRALLELQRHPHILQELFKEDTAEKPLPVAHGRSLTRRFSWGRVIVASTAGTILFAGAAFAFPKTFVPDTLAADIAAVSASFMGTKSATHGPSAYPLPDTQVAVAQPIPTERIIERVTVPTTVVTTYPQYTTVQGISESQLATELQQFKNSLLSQMYGAVSNLSSSVSGNTQSIQLMNAPASNLAAVKISDSTITGGSISGAGGSFSSLSASGDTNLTNVSASGTASLRSLLLSGSGTYFNFGTTTGASGYGLRDNGGIVQFKNDGGSWIGLGAGGGGGASAWATTTDSLAVYTTDPSQTVIVGAIATSSPSSIFETHGNAYISGLLGIGTTSPGSLLSVGNANGINFTTGTSTFSTAGGINLGSGCFSINGVCVGSNALSLASWFSTTTDQLKEGTTNTYYTDTRARAALSSSAPGLAYDNTTGTFSLASGYSIPLTASTSDSYIRSLFSATAPVTYNSASGAIGLGIIPASLGGTGVNASSWSGIFGVNNGTVYQAATTTFSSGLAYANGNVTNTGVTSIIAGTNVSISGSTGAVTIHATASGGGSGTVSTSTGETKGYLPYWTSTNGTPATLGAVATTTIAASGPLSFSANPIVIGNSPFTLSIATSSLGLFTTDITEGTNKYYTDARVNAYIDASSTIPKSYSTNTWTGTQTFAGPITVNGSSATSTFLSNIGIAGNIIPSANNTYELGSSLYTWKSVYVGPGSLFVNGQEVLHTDVSQNVVLSSNANQNLELQTSGTGNVELNPIGGGLILAKAGIQLSAGKSITTTDSSALLIPFGVAAGNLTLSGNALTATNTNGGISLTPIGTGGVYITSGNLGVGTTNPATKLEVNGTASSSALVVSSLSGILKGNGASLVSAAVGGTDYEFPLSFSAPFSRSVNTVSLSTVPIAQGGTATTTFYAGGLVFSDGTKLTQAANSVGNGILFWDSVNRRLGVGTTTPPGKLSVYTSTNQASAFTVSNSIGSTTLQVDTIDTNPQIFSVATSTGVDYFDVGQGGNVGVSSSTPWRTFSVNGTVSFANLTSGTTGNTLCLTANNEVTSGASCTVSSKRYKNSIAPLDETSGLAEVLALEPVSFRYDQGYGDNGAATQIGFIAEQAITVDPRLVPTDNTGQPSGFFYQNFTAILAKAIQELSAKVDALASAIAGFAQSITTLVLNATEVHTQRLCVGDTCVTEAELKQLLAQSGAQAAPAGADPIPSDTGTAVSTSTDPVIVVQSPATTSDPTASSTAPITDATSSAPAP